jgi:hypothetical protein
VTRIVRVFIYKRTHNGDPTEDGRFGVHNCMGAGLRGSDFGAVIGVGGKGSEAKHNQIARKLNWIGIGPHWETLASKPWVLVRFDHFLWLRRDEMLCDKAPRLANRMYEKRHPPRFVFSDKLPDEEQKEVLCLLKMAENAPPSRPARRRRADGRCHPKC